jgi:hypothetical protein
MNPTGSAADDAREACCLAHAAFRATGGKAIVSIVLPSAAAAAAATAAAAAGGNTGRKNAAAAKAEELKRAAALKRELELWQEATAETIDGTPLPFSGAQQIADLNKSGFTDDAYATLLRLVSNVLAPPTTPPTPPTQPQQQQQEEEEEEQDGGGGGDRVETEGVPAAAGASAGAEAETGGSDAAGELLLRRVPRVHTKAELTELLADKASLWRLMKEGSEEKALCAQAKELLATRDEFEHDDPRSAMAKAADGGSAQGPQLQKEEQEDEQEEEQEGGSDSTSSSHPWAGLLESLTAAAHGTKDGGAAATRRRCPFQYPSSPFGNHQQQRQQQQQKQQQEEEQGRVQEQRERSGGEFNVRGVERRMLQFLTSEEFLHFAPARNMLRRF